MTALWHATRLAFLLALALFTPPASAHLTPNSELVLDFHPDAVLVDVIIPEGDYAAASHAPPGRDAARAARWLAGQVAARSPDGRAWRIAVEQAEFAQIAGPPDLHATLRLTPPPGDDTNRIDLTWSAVVAQNPDHFALIVLGDDQARGILKADRRLIGAVRGDRQTIRIDRGAPSALAGFRAAFRLGNRHIAQGTDHLLFLLCLLLPAPLLAIRRADGRRVWGPARPVRQALGKLTGTITAFTIGHSLTLLAAAIGGWHLPVAPVEVMIALSILVAAIHALRPIFPGREAWVAAGFGLIHGLAFATLIGDAGISGAGRMLAILGFNLGIEAVQIIVAGLAMIPLLLLARHPVYRWVRIGGACFAATAAVLWIIERAGIAPNPLGALIGAAAGHALWLWGALIALALVTSVAGRTTDDAAMKLA